MEGHERLFKTDREGAEIRQYLRKLQRFLRFLLRAAFHGDYRKHTRAQWLCTVKTCVRLVAGVVAVVAYGERHHLRMILRMGPIAVHTAAALKPLGSDSPAFTAE